MKKKASDEGISRHLGLNFKVKTTSNKVIRSRSLHGCDLAVPASASGFGLHVMNDCGVQVSVITDKGFHGLFPIIKWNS